MSFRRSLYWPVAVVIVIAAAHSLPTDRRLLGFIPVVSCQGQNPPVGCPQNDGKGWEKKKTVKYMIVGMDGVTKMSTSQANQAINGAFTKWTSENNNNDSKVKFQEAVPPEAAQIVIRLATEPVIDPRTSQPARAMTYMYPPGQPVQAAVTTLDLNGLGGVDPRSCGFPTPVYLRDNTCTMWDEFAPNLLDAVKSLVMHEIGHTMGLTDVRGAGANGYGKSIMGSAANPNDCIRLTATSTCHQQNRTPTSGFPTGCDRAAINGVYTPLADGQNPDGSYDGPDEGNAPPIPTGSAPPGVYDSDYDGYARPPWGTDCNDFSSLIHPNQTHEDKCAAFVYYGGQVKDIDCDGQDDTNECVSVSTSWRFAVDNPLLFPVDEPPASGAPNTLGDVGTQYLYPGDYIESPNGRFRLVYQGDGNLVLLDKSTTPWTALWAAASNSDPGCQRSHCGQTHRVSAWN